MTRVASISWAVYLITMVVVTGNRMQAQVDGATVPLHLSFQGVLIQPDGTVYADGRYAVSVKLFPSAVGGTAVFEDVISTTIVGGVFNLIIGEQEPLDNVDFTQQLWIEIGLPGTTQTAFEPRTRLTTAPYLSLIHI